MLRKRSRAITSKQPLMVDNFSLSSPAEEQNIPSSSFFGSPRFFKSFALKVSSDIESSMSPISILDSRPFSSFGSPNFLNPGSPFGSVKSSSTRLTHETGLETSKHHFWEEKIVGLGIVDALNGKETNQKPFENENSHKILLGSQLKIQIPSIPSYFHSPTESPKSPPDFGIKTRNSHLGSSSFRSMNSEPPVPPVVHTGCFSKREMELSEDYTCVVTYGPNPRITHIYGDCIVGDCCNIIAPIGNNIVIQGHAPCYPSEKFLSLCYNCKKSLKQGKDIFMYNI